VNALHICIVFNEAQQMFINCVVYEGSQIFLQAWLMLLTSTCRTL